MIGGGRRQVCAAAPPTPYAPPTPLAKSPRIPAADPLQRRADPSAGREVGRGATLSCLDDFWQPACCPIVGIHGNLHDRAAFLHQVPSPIVRVHGNLYDRAPFGAKKTGQAGHFISVGLDSYFSAWNEDPADDFPISSAGPPLAFLIFARLGAPTWLMTMGSFCPIGKFLA